MSTKIVSKVRKSKHFANYSCEKERNFSLPAVFVHKLHLNPRLFQLKIATYSFLKMFRSGACKESTLIKILPKVLQNNFQSNRKSEVLNTIETLVIDGILVRYESAQGNWIKIQNFKEMVLCDFKENHFLEKFKKIFFTFTNLQSFVDGIKTKFKSTSVLIRAIMDSVEIRDKSEEKRKALKAKNIGASIKTDADDKILSSDILYQKCLCKISAPLIIDAGKLNIKPQQLYRIFSKSYADGTISRVKSCKVIVCNSDFAKQVNQKEYFSDLSEAKIEDDQEKLKDFFSFLSYKQSQRELDYHFFPLFGNKGEIRALCQTSAYYRSVNDVNNIKGRVKIPAALKGIISKRKIIQNKNYEVYDDGKLVEEKKSFNFSEININAAVSFGNLKDHHDKEKKILKVYRKHLMMYNQYLNTDIKLEFVFHNSEDEKSFYRSLYKQELMLNPTESKKRFSFFGICYELGIDCSFFRFDESKVEYNTEIGIVSILKIMLKKEQIICDKLNVTIGVHTISELKEMIRKTKPTLTDSQKFKIAQKQEVMFNSKVNNALTKINYTKSYN